VQIRENLQGKYGRSEKGDNTEMLCTNPRYDRHKLSPSGGISEGLVMAMCLDVVLESDI
jgi:hypothetical protein